MGGRGKRLHKRGGRGKRRIEKKGGEYEGILEGKKGNKMKDKEREDGRCEREGILMEGRERKVAVWK